MAVGDGEDDWWIWTCKESQWEGKTDTGVPCNNVSLELKTNWTNCNHNFCTSHKNSHVFANAMCFINAHEKLDLDFSINMSIIPVLVIITCSIFKKITRETDSQSCFFLFQPHMNLNIRMQSFLVLR